MDRFCRRSPEDVGGVITLVSEVTEASFRKKTHHTTAVSFRELA